MSSQTTGILLPVVAVLCLRLRGLLWSCLGEGGVAVYRKKEGTAGEIVGTTIVFRKRQMGVVRCLGCSGETQYSEEEDDHYCWECEEYVGDVNEEVITG